jgi:uncharacterized Ntn-hydrolase superfamily protein
VTYSIVARDSKTGEMGVAVQSHYFSVGSVVTWARAGVGAVATQAMAEVSYGPLGLQLMAAGKSAKTALGTLVRADSKAATRQVAMVDAKGGVAAHTGSKCIPHAGHVVGDQVSCQGNIMKTERVWKSMHGSFVKNTAMPLAERLVAALEAGEETGGDARGKQSSAILVVSPQLSPNDWSGRLVDLRVEDHPAPVPELKRLLRYQRGYDWVSKGDELLTSEKYAEALKAYAKALRLVPEVLELKYWVGLSMLETKEKDRGVDMLKQVFAEDRNWVEITKGIIRARTMPIDPKTAKDLLGQQRLTSSPNDSTLSRKSNRA